MTIKLTVNEVKIFKIIKEVALSISPTVTPRVAGGWVRDKLLSTHSDDIDIALDNISGFEFAKEVSEYLACNNNSGGKMPNVVKANPDKSKHLETAILRIMGKAIDFVAFRKESYSDSRIPIILSGTPYEDAIRRDLTINSLFYNVITEEVEDFSGRGLNDLKNKVIDTPLDPLINLSDDPLRIMRIFRFKAKLEGGIFCINERIYKAIDNSKIREAFINKISQERVWAEFSKMLEYPNGIKIGVLEIIKHNFIEPLLRINTKSHSKDKLVEINNINAELFYLMLKENEFLEYFDKTLLGIWLLLICIKDNNLICIKDNLILSNIIKDAFKPPKSIIKDIEMIQDKLIYLKGINKKFVCINSIKELLIDLNTPRHFEIISIAYFITKRTDYYFILSTIIENDLSALIFNTKPLINGNDIKALGNVNNQNIKKYLIKAFKYQIINQISTKEEILKKLFK